MTITDDNHEVAKIIADLKDRVSDLEERSRSDPKPNLLISETETVGADDRVDAVTVHDITAATWDNVGWRTSSWGQYDRA